MIDEMDRPNGLSFSPDESLLYVADSGEPKNILVNDVVDDVRLKNGREFADMKPGLADGMRIDEDGNLWTSAACGAEKILTTSAVILRTEPCWAGFTFRNRFLTYVLADCTKIAFSLQPDVHSIRFISIREACNIES